MGKWYQRFKLEKKRKKSTSHDESLPGAPASPGFLQGLQLLYEPEGETLLDIVFVHGLTGDRIRTWSTSDSEPAVLWPQQLLPQRIPNARILTHGYDAYVIHPQAGPAGRVTKNRISHHARDLVNALAVMRQECLERPIIFVVHSLGGLVCKDALAASRNDPDPNLRNIYDSTFGIAFLSTPHHGSHLANKAKLPAMTLGAFKDCNTSLLSLLEIDSEILERIHTDFMLLMRERERLGRPIHVTCFFESLSMPVAGMVVKKESAIIQGHNAVSIHADHRDMTKFATMDDPGFKSILGQLKIWTGEIEAVAESTIKLTDLDQKCLQSLAYQKMESRYFAIDEPIPETCTWLQEHPFYRSWKEHRDLDMSHGLLWIKGKPGSGKSTLMKAALKYETRIEPSVGEVQIGFFFNARGSELERSAFGMYRSLLHQFCQAHRRVLKDLSAIYQRKESTIGLDKLEWYLSELSEFFHSAITRMDPRPLTLFIDALDECDEDEVRQVIKSLEKSAAYARDVDRMLKICWSSRHYPRITVQHGFQLRMEDQNSQDIVHYVDQSLSPSHLAYLEPGVVEKIITKASGIFLWTVLVVRKVARAAERRLPKKEITRLVQDLPLELDDLFHAILQSLNPADRSTSQCLFQWVLLPDLQLHLRELRLALAFSDQHPPESVDALEGCESWIPGILDFKERVNDLSGGLVEAIDAVNFETPNMKDFTVQMIHESVRDFFVVGRGFKVWGYESRNQWKEEGYKVLASAAFGYCGLRDHHLEEISDSSFDKSLAHIPVVLSPYLKPLPQLLNSGLLKLFLYEPFFNQYSASWSPEVYEEFVLFCLSISLSRESKTRQLLAYKGYHEQFQSHVITGAYLSRIACLVKLGLSLPLSLQNDALGAAAWIGSPNLIKHLLNQGARISTPDSFGECALRYAVAAGKVEAARLLLEMGADIEKPGNMRCRTPIFDAVLGGRAEMVDLLLEHNAKFNVYDSHGYAPLHCVYHCEDAATGKVLLLKGAEIDVKTNDGFKRTPLFLACLRGQPEIVQFLVDQGASISARDTEMWTPLMAACENGDIKNVHCLLAAGVSLEDQDTRGCTALIVAAYSGNDMVVDHLLEHGTNIGHRDQNGDTALHYAAVGGYYCAVRVLLSHGADYSIQNSEDETALEATLKTGRAPVMRFLNNEKSKEGPILQWFRSSNWESWEHAAYLLHMAEYRDLSNTSQDGRTTQSSFADRSAPVATSIKRPLDSASLENILRKIRDQHKESKIGQYITAEELVSYALSKDDECEESLTSEHS